MTLVAFALAACSHDAPTKPTNGVAATRLAYMFAERIHVIVLSPAGDNPVILASDVDWLGTPMWSPDGGSVVTSGFGPVFNNAIFILPAGERYEAHDRIPRRRRAHAHCA